VAEPLLIGLLLDTPGAPGVDIGVGLEANLRLAVDPLVASGRIDRDVEFVHAYGLGLPEGTAVAVERAYEKLAADGVLAVVGPAIGDNALVATPLADRFELPTINWAGTERARSDWMFHLQVGSHEDESIVMARHLAGLGISRVGVLHDRSPIGRRYFGFFQSESEALGLTVAASTSIGPVATTAEAEVERLRSASVDAVVYLGLGLVTPAVSAALRAAGLDVPRVMNTAGLRGYLPSFAEQIDGWTYVDMVSDDNRVFAALKERDPSGFAVGLAYGYDLGQVLAEGLARATETTRRGVREGLENVKWIPAAEGYDGTMLSLGHFDRGALHGRYLVMRQWQGTRSVQVGS
jgi:branched-chain amino acid transport system substrate-binding protein